MSNLTEIRDTGELIELMDTTAMSSLNAEELSVLLLEDLVEECPGLTVLVDDTPDEDFVELVVRIPR